MELWEKHVIYENLPNLIHTTFVNTPLMALLKANRVIFDVDVERLERLSNRYEKSKELYDILVTRRNCYDVILEALETEKQTRAAYILYNAKQRVHKVDSSNAVAATGESGSDDDEKDPMELWDKVLQTHRTKLIAFTRVNASLLTTLKENNVLSHFEVEEINNINGGDFEKSHRLYEVIETRCNGYNFLLEALQNAKQTGAVAILFYAKKIIDKEDSSNEAVALREIGDDNNDQDQLGFWRRTLPEQRMKLIQNTRVTSRLLTTLMDKGILSRADVEEINNQHDRFEKSRCLYELIQTRINGYNILLEALKKERQTRAAHILFLAGLSVIEENSFHQLVAIGEKEREELIKNTDVTELLVAILISNNVISDYEAEEIKNNGCTPSENASRLYEIIDTKINGYNFLLEALEKANQKSAAHILLGAMQMGHVKNLSSTVEQMEEITLDNEGGDEKNEIALPSSSNKNSARFAECVDKLQDIINQSESRLILISTIDSKLTVSKIQDTLQHGRILVKEMGLLRHIKLYFSGVENLVFRNSSRTTEPLWVFYESKSSRTEYKGKVGTKWRRHLQLFKYLKLRKNVKIVLVLQYSEQETEEYILQAEISNAEVISDNFKWEQLTPSEQKRLMEHPQSVVDKGKLESLSRLFRLYVNEKDNIIKSQLLQGQLLVDIMNDVKPEICRKTIPQVKTNYYISRRLRERCCISKSILQTCSENEIVVVSEIICILDKTNIINDFKLRFGPCNGNVNLSINQKDNKKLTATYILLTHLQHFEKICENLANDKTVSVHWLEFVNGKFRWKETRGRGACNMKSIHSNICQQSEQHEFHESNFLTEINKKPLNEPVIICDSPGMGKSILLANLAKQTELNTSRAKTFVVFFVLTDFISVVRSHMTDNDTQISSDTLKEVIYSGISAYHFNKPLMEQSSNPTATSLHIFFDGLDEVPADYLNIAYDCFHKITNEFKFARLYITTRTNLLQQVECQLKTLAYHIQPFDHDDQINFLTKYWSSLRLAGGKKINKDLLLAYTNMCLGMLKEKLTGDDREITGVPLQCLLVRDVFYDEAQEYADTSSHLTPENVESTVNIDSINSMKELYDRMFKTKYEAFRQRYLNDKPIHSESLDNVHVYVGTKVIFKGAEWYKTLGPCLLDKKGFSGLKTMFHDWNGTLSKFQDGMLPRQNLLNVGILEAVGNGELQFIHRTFAEYLLAKFVASHLIQKKRSAEKVTNFIYKGIFETYSTNVTISHQYNVCQESYQFKFPVICHFLNLSVPSSQPSTGTTSRDVTVKSKRDEEIVHACIQADYQNILHLFLVEDHIRGKKSRDMQRELLLLATRFSSSKSFDLLGYRDDLFASNPSPLHIAVEQGTKTMVTHLLTTFGFQQAIKEWKQTEIQNLIHLCIARTKNMNEERIEEKIGILNALNIAHPEIASKVINESGMLPIFQLGVHSEIINALLPYTKSEILCHERTADNKSVLQVAKEYLTCSELETFVAAIKMHHDNEIMETFEVHMSAISQTVLDSAARLAGGCDQNLVVGDAQHCSFNKIILAMMGTSVSHELDTKWHHIALEMNTTLSMKDKLDQDQRLGLIGTSTILEKIISNWRAGRGKDATMRELIAILERSKMKVIAETLCEQFKIHC